MKKQPGRIFVGDVVKIPLNDGTHVYSQVFPGGSYAFYDCQTRENLAINAVVELPILFFAAVADYAIKEGRWEVVGNTPISNKIQPPPKFIQDPLNTNKFRLYLNSGEIVKATREQCLGLEPAASWDPEQMEDRLIDHYAGRENKWVKLMQIK